MLALTQTWIPPRSNGSEQQRTTVNINVCCSLEFVDVLRGERILACEGDLLAIVSSSKVSFRHPSVDSVIGCVQTISAIGYWLSAIGYRLFAFRALRFALCARRFFCGYLFDLLKN
jgi:hypothetical protein